MKAGDAVRAFALAGLLAGSPWVAGRIRPRTPMRSPSCAGVVHRIAVYRDFPPYSFGRRPPRPAESTSTLHRQSPKPGCKLKLRLISAGESVTDDLRNHVWKGHYLGGGVADLMLHVGYDPAFAEREKNALLFEPYFHETVAWPTCRAASRTSNHRLPSPSTKSPSKATPSAITS